MLTKVEIERYSKQILLPGIGMRGQEKLKAVKVLVIGAGGLGCPALQYLAAAGVGAIGIIDFDNVDETNLQRQVLYSSDDVGKAKAISAKEKISQLNRFISVQAFNVKLEPANAAEIVSGFDIVLDCTDNFESRYLINDVCVLLKKPFIYGGIHKYEGQVSVFNFRDADGAYGPTYRCAFSEPHPEETRLNCSLIGVLGTLPGIIGTMQANEAIKMITGIAEVYSGKILLFNALNNSITEIKISRNESAWGEIPGTVEELKAKIYFSSCDEVANK